MAIKLIMEKKMNKETTIENDNNLATENIEVYTRVKSCLLYHCVDLDKLAKRIGRTPASFKKALNGEYPEDDERVLTLDEIKQISEITEITPSVLVSFNPPDEEKRLSLKMKFLRKFQRVIPTSLGITRSILIHCEGLYENCRKVLNKHTAQIKILKQDNIKYSNAIAALEKKMRDQEERIDLLESHPKQFTANFTSITEKKHEPNNKCYKRNA